MGMILLRPLMPLIKLMALMIKIKILEWKSCYDVFYFFEFLSQHVAGDDIAQ